MVTWFNNVNVSRPSRRLSIFLLLSNQEYDIISRIIYLYIEHKKKIVCVGLTSTLILLFILFIYITINT